MGDQRYCTVEGSYRNKPYTRRIPDGPPSTRQLLNQLTFMEGAHEKFDERGDAPAEGVRGAFERRRKLEEFLRELKGVLLRKALEEKGIILP